MSASLVPLPYMTKFVSKIIYYFNFTIRTPYRTINFNYFTIAIIIYI
jgi:hypothetical protein